MLRTRNPFDSKKVRFEGGAATITSAMANHLRAKGVNIQLDCTANRISTAHDDAVRVEGVKVQYPTHPSRHELWAHTVSDDT